MNLDVVMPWLGAVALIISLATSIQSVFTSGSKENAKKLAAVNSDLASHDRRIQAVEAELRHLPDKDTVLELKLAIAELKGTVGTLGENVGSIQRTVHRIDDYLRQDGK